VTPRRAASGLAPVVVALAAAWPGSTARANLAAPTVDPSYAARPAPAASTPLVVREERLTFSCGEAGARPSCTLDATYVIENPTTAVVETPVVFLTYEAEELSVTIDGAAAPSDLSPEEQAALDVTATQLATAGLPGRGELPRARADFRLRVEALGRREVRTRGVVPLGRRHDKRPLALGAEAVTARHLALGGRASGDAYFLQYLMSPINTWARVGEIKIRVEHPSRWRFRAGFANGRDPGAHEPRWSREARGAVAVATAETRGRQDETLWVRFFAPPPSIENGGVLLGVGGRLGDRSGFRARLGYEIAWAKSRLISLSADTDFRELLQLTPAFEVALPAVLIVPSLGAGLGLPVQLRPDARVGVRGQLSAMFYAVGVVASLDYFPKVDVMTDPTRLRATLLARLSF
jgi:hypothetical protein